MKNQFKFDKPKKSVVCKAKLWFWFKKYLIFPSSSRMNKSENPSLFQSTQWILGLLKPTSGEILIDGLKIEKNRIETLQKINFISPYIELPKKLTVKQNLIVYARLYDVKNINNRIDYLIEKFRLQDLLNKLSGELSSGQKNRVSLAKSIINDPLVLLLDEPTASLDPETGDFVRSFIEEYQKEKGTSILLASHNMSEVERLCSSVLMMNNGSIIDKGSTYKLIQKHGRKNMEEVFLKLTREKIWIWIKCTDFF